MNEKTLSKQTVVSALMLLALAIWINPSDHFNSQPSPLLFKGRGNIAGLPDQKAETSSINSDHHSQQQLKESYGKLPLIFEANRGQTDPDVKFLSRGQGHSLYCLNLGGSKPSPLGDGFSRFESRAKVAP